jgi:NAD(P)-dependent dehydrogenase (short-subunit alcohol dehydrogenase family)
VDTAVSEIAAAGIQVIGIPCHVGKEVDRVNLIAKTVEKWGKIDIIVSNAAVQPAGGGSSFHDCSQCPVAEGDGEIIGERSS